MSSPPRPEDEPPPAVLYYDPNPITAKLAVAGLRLLRSHVENRHNAVVAEDALNSGECRHGYSWTLIRTRVPRGQRGKGCTKRLQLRQRREAPPSMRLFDTHAHLDDAAFGQDRDVVLQRASDAGVTRILTVGTDLSSSRRAVALAGRYPRVYATVGVHPHEASSATRSLLTDLEALASHPRVVAIGEIGLDFYRDLAPRDVQRTVFAEQLALAARISKPVVVHIRPVVEEGTPFPLPERMDDGLNDFGPPPLAEVRNTLHQLFRHGAFILFQ